MTTAELIDLVQPMLPPYPGREESLGVYAEWWRDAAMVLAKRLAESEAYVKEYYRQAQSALAAQSRAEAERMEMFAAKVNDAAKGGV